MKNEVAFFEAAWDILVEHASARPLGKDDFVFAFTEDKNPAHEYRFMGDIGFGAKFWRNNGKFYITCYREEETPKVKLQIETINGLLKDLQEKMGLV